MGKAEDIFANPIGLSGIEPETTDVAEAIKKIHSYLSRAAVLTAYIKSEPGEFKEFTCQMKAMTRVNESGQVEVTHLTVGVF